MPPLSQPAAGRTVQIDGVTLHLARPMTSAQDWIGNREILKQLLACWLVIDPRDLPLLLKEYGAAGHRQDDARNGRGPRAQAGPLYFSMHRRYEAEDLLVTPVLAESGTITYHASPLVTAVLTGSICVLDEGNRA
ncbi:MAG: AAA family ATPase [Nitrospiraceae bacterium]